MSKAMRDIGRALHREAAEKYARAELRWQILRLSACRKTAIWRVSQATARLPAGRGSIALKSLHEEVETLDRRVHAAELRLAFLEGATCDHPLAFTEPGGWQSGIGETPGHPLVHCGICLSTITDPEFIENSGQRNGDMLQRTGTGG